jgi:hypothetical protein
MALGPLLALPLSHVPEFKLFGEPPLTHHRRPVPDSTAPIRSGAVWTIINHQSSTSSTSSIINHQSSTLLGSAPQSVISESYRGQNIFQHINDRIHSSQQNTVNNIRDAEE